VECSISLQNHIRILKRKCLAVFFEILGANLGGWPILEAKILKNAEIKQSARANLITVMLRCLFYTTKGIPMNSGAIEIGHQNRWALGVRDCRSAKNK
jgi:hypothetical protein